MQTNRAISMLMVATAATLWGFIGVCIRPLSEAGLDTVQINAIRSSVCTVLFGIVIIVMDRKLFSIALKDIWLFIIAAAAKVCMDLAYVQAQTMIDLSIAALLLSTDCYFVIVASMFFYRKDVTVMKIVSAVIGFTGCAMVIGLFSGNTGDINTAGILVGLGSGVAGATYAFSLKKAMDRGYRSTTVLFYMFLLGSVFLIPFMDVSNAVGAVTSDLRYIGDILILGLVFTLVTYHLYTEGLKNLGPTTTSILLFLETAMAAVAGWIFFSEELEPIGIFGMVLVLLSVSIMDLKLTGRKKTAEREKGETP